MRHLLALLDCGTHGTQAEPAGPPARVPRKNASNQRFAKIGTRGTLGTPAIEQVGAHDSMSQRIADLADAYAERIAVVMEAGDISESEARRIAEAEIGAAFVDQFIEGS